MLIHDEKGGLEILAKVDDYVLDEDEDVHIPLSPEKAAELIRSLSTYIGLSEVPRGLPS